ncbi:tetratricopeptide repeat protein [Amycolatopsis sp. FBCC-B4732]|uniref:tetratricopeptide repeat protein n=1 Tax=Amycolatopsis sp. FBCC-B4732 TaxID=3079339 RepID=UPI001FF5EC95|nr:tetratricopeptide repeat protein [Amycolatopsis sp. FBCC-B4732]UOX90437.1 tetratricopeptide repeat protein [Amycolatopsis sp. FBCC-B4732]
MGDAVLLQLDVRANVVQLIGPGLDVSERHNGVTQELLDSISDVQRARRRSVNRVADPGAVPSLRAVGRLLGDALLPGRVAAGLIAQLGESRRVNVALTSETYAGLPWEAVTLPGTEVPLVLQPGVQVFRTVKSPQPRPTLRGGPLRIAFAVAAPTENGGALLNYERELRDIEEAVRPARAAGLELTLVRYATLGSLRSCVENVQPHVLHVSTHGGVGSLTLEDDEGRPRPVGADEFVTEVLGAGPVPDLICLAACFTSAEAAPGLPSFAARLVHSGVKAVVGTQTSVTDRYSTLFFTRLYNILATGSTDLAAATADARRAVQEQLSGPGEPRQQQIARLDEWAIVTLSTTDETPTLISGTPVEGAPAVRVEPDGSEFIGRRGEQRLIARLLLEESVSLHGLGGAGKTALAWQVIASLEERMDLTAMVSGTATAAETFAVAARCASADVRDDNAGLPWAERLRRLASRLPSGRSLVLVVDGSCESEGLRELMTVWAATPGLRLLHTSRVPEIPGTTKVSLPQLSLPETVKLAWSLPAVGRWTDNSIEAAFDLLGGHPAAWFSLDRSLSLSSSVPDSLVTRFAEITWSASGAADRVRELADGNAYLTLLAASIFNSPFPAEGLDKALLGANVGTGVRPETERLIHLGLLAVRLDGLLDCPRWLRVILQANASDDFQRETLNRFEFMAGEFFMNRVLSTADQQDPYNIRSDSDIHDFTEANQHFLAAGALPQAAAAAVLAAQALRREGAWVARDQILRQNLSVPGWDERSRIHLLQALGELALDSGDYDEALSAFDEAYDLSRGLSAESEYDAHQRSRIQGHIALVYKARGQLDDAERAFTNVLESARADGDEIVEASALYNLAELFERQGALDKAEPLYLDALTLKESQGDRLGAANCIHQLGMLNQFRGQFQEAFEYYQAAARIRAEVGDAHESTISVAQLGILLTLVGEWSGARRLLSQALGTFEAVGDVSMMAVCYEKLGIVATAYREFDLAERYLARSVRIHSELGEREGLQSAGKSRAELLVARGDYAAATDAYEKLGASGRLQAFRDLERIDAARGDFMSLVRHREQLKVVIAAQNEGERVVVGDLFQMSALAGDFERADRTLTEYLDVMRPPEQSIEFDQWANIQREKIERCRRDLAVERREFLKSHEFGARDTAKEAISKRQYAKAGQYRRLAASIAEQIVALDSRNFDDVLNVAGDYDDLGDLALHVNRLAEAEEWFARALQLRTEILSSVPDHERVLRGVAVVQERLAQITNLSERHADAMTHFNQARAIREALAERFPGRVDLAEEYGVLMLLLERLEPDQAAEAKRRALEVLTPVSDQLSETQAALLTWAAAGPDATVEVARYDMGFRTSPPL